MSIIKTKTIRCPHLIKWLTETCKAEDKPYMPSYFQLKQYCKSSDYKKCPFYLNLHEYEKICLTR